MDVKAGYSRSEVIRTETTNPYYFINPSSDRTLNCRVATLTMAIIPAIMTGTTHFIIKSGRRTAMAEIPTPDLAVPYLILAIATGTRGYQPNSRKRSRSIQCS